MTIEQAKDRVVESTLPSTVKPSKVRVRDPRTGKTTVYLLTPTTHPKGGDAWSVADAEGKPLGVLRRWEADATNTRMTLRNGRVQSATISKVTEVRWSAYQSGRVAVRGSRSEALRVLTTGLHCAVSVG